jgi:predicted glutamine amidotransferase
MDILARAARAAAGADCDSGGWGVAHCYGNRLETIRSAQPCAQDPDFGKLSEIRTDMALLSIGGVVPASPRELRPYVRRETGHIWAFAHPGLVRHEDRLDTGGRITDSRNPSERFFLHLLSKIEEQSPAESLSSAMVALGEDDSLSFCMMCAEMMLVGCWHGGASEPGEQLWVGEGESARYFSTAPLLILPEVHWHAMPNRTVLAITRTRRELP